MAIPAWAKKFQTEGTQVVCIKNRFYLYKIKSVWNKEKKRAKKITEKYLGKITEEGLVKPKHQRILESYNGIIVKEYGASKYIISRSEDILTKLKKVYPDLWKELFCFSVMRLFHSSPIKNIFYHYQSCDLSDSFTEAKLSPKSISEQLHLVGRNRQRMVNFMKEFMTGKSFEVIDLTHIFSMSENIISATLGHNNEKEYTPQINLIMILSTDENQPSFFRMVPGSIRDVSVIPSTINEAGIKNAVIIGDKGFYSEKNVDYLETQGLNYVLPLRRNLAMINYEAVKQGQKQAFEDYLIFEKRIVWYHTTKITEKQKIVLFLDERLKTEETKDFITRLKSKDLPTEEFFQEQHKLGTIAVITNLQEEPKRIFELLKSRINIEQLFDTFKNVLNADRTYMRDDEQLQGWFFINFISLLLYYRIYNELIKNELIEKLTPKDVLMHLSRIQKLRIGTEWKLAEMPKQSKNIITKLKIDLPIT